MTAPRRIALFTGNYNHISDGVSLTLNRLVAHLEEQGRTVVVFGPTIEDPPFEHEGTLVPVPSMAMPGRNEYRISLWFPYSLRKRLARFGPDIIHIATPDILGLKALLFARRRGIPVVASYHTHFTSYFKYYRMTLLEPGFWAYLRWFYRRCEQLYVPSTSMAGVLAEHGITQGVQIWPRGVDTTLFNPDRRSLEWRRSLGFSDEEVVITFVSRLVIEKGPDIFARVVQALQQEGLPVRGLVVGEGPVRSLIAELLPRAIFTGHLSGNELARAYASSDIFLFPSETETFGNVTLEAMASGLPTVCADATGSTSLVRHGETGFLVPPGEEAAFTHRVRMLVQDHVLRQRQGAHARTVAGSYSWKLILGRIDQYYDQILEQSDTEAPPASQN